MTVLSKEAIEAILKQNECCYGGHAGVAKCFMERSIDDLAASVESLRAENERRQARNTHLEAQLSDKIWGSGRFPSGPVCIVCGEVMSLDTKLKAENERLRAFIQRMMSTAGHPDAAEGCRLIIKLGREALEEK